MRTAIMILAICLFIAGPAAKVYGLDHANIYMIASGIGLLMITGLGFIKKKD
ncbi:LPXTG cell wall anchor domain-containing protein [Pedobacter frigidisoli]|uniref:LPXTG cell wall anchor domain-containing protein n=1 Tax=Pedobacter frigidisoli TaxID=2530455 RepID=A0A4R0P1R0_9SPHI|nr:LPXTG cell wall anchor domain-containing protein [Pedobacter frigidisoli]TCD07080.1 LPXTG cell wall anchor domain-containing protein [Pedobacter frigidisoli]